MDTSALSLSENRYESVDSFYGDGEVIIILRNADCPFTQPAGKPLTLTSRDSDIFQWLYGKTQTCFGSLVNI